MFVAARHTWGEDRVFFLDGATMKSLPRAWTDHAEQDVFMVMAAGRSPFRCEDLLWLADLIDGLSEAGGDDGV